MINTYNKEVKVLLLIFLFKIIILFQLPLTGDEAYFIKWGQNLSSGYYDHPPMVGWLIHFLSYINESYFFFRWFAVFTTFTTAFVIYKIALLYNTGKQKAFFISLIFLASPLDLLIVILTNDIALLFFSSFGTLFLLYSLEKKSWFKYALLAGIFLGSAFLSKYFAAFLMLSLLVFSLYMYKRKAIKTVLVVSVISLLFVAQNLYFNYNNCWNNIMFNFFARTQDHSYHLSSLFGYLALLTYVVSPWGIYYLFKTKIINTKLLKLLFFILSLSFVVFFIVSLKNNIGLHWFLLFVPYIFLLFSSLDEQKLHKIFRYNYIFTFIHVLIIMLAFSFPTSLLKGHKKYSDVVMYTQPQEICNELDKLHIGKLFADGYSTASVLSYHCKRDMTVIFSKSKYGRLDDRLLDVRDLKDKDITIFSKKSLRQSAVDVCETMTDKTLNIGGAEFHLSRCEKFNYDKYKSDFLSYQKKRFYSIPSWLPIGECYFNDRYYEGKR